MVSPESRRWSSLVQFFKSLRAEPKSIWKYSLYELQRAGGNPTVKPPTWDIWLKTMCETEQMTYTIRRQRFTPSQPYLLHLYFSFICRYMLDFACILLYLNILMSNLVDIKAAGDLWRSSVDHGKPFPNKLDHVRFCSGFNSCHKIQTYYEIMSVFFFLCSVNCLRNPDVDKWVNVCQDQKKMKNKWS